MGRIAEIKRILGRTRPRRRLGQTFMVDPNLLTALVRDAAVTAQDTVLEIGTGIGALTEVIADAARMVVSVEIDPNLVRIAREKLAPLGNVQIVQADFLGPSGTVSPEVEGLVLRAGREGAAAAVESAPIVVSNLPYSASGPIIAALMLWTVPVRRAVVTVQKEMGERLVAQPGSKDYGRLSALVQSTTGAKILRTMPSECFWPRPAVDSAAVRLGPRKTSAEHAKAVGRLARGVFQHRRKTISNALLEATNLDIDGERAERLLKEAGIDRTLRADQITPAQFDEMAGLLKK